MVKNINLTRIILAVLILFIPLYPKFPLLSLNGIYVAVRLDDIIVLASLIVFSLNSISSFRQILNIKINRLLITYLIAISASTAYAILISQIYPSHLHLLHLFRRFEYLSLFFISATQLPKLKEVFGFYPVLITALLGVCVYGLGQKYLSFPVISTMNEEFSKGQLLQMNNWTRISSTFAGHYDLAAYLSVILIIILGSLFISRSVFIKAISLFSFLLGFYILNLTASRISVFAFWGGGVIALFLIRKYIWIFPLSFLVIASIATSKDLNQRLLATIPAFQKQLTVPTATLPPPPPTSSFPSPTSKIMPTPTIFLSPTPTVFRHRLEDEFPPADVDAGVARSGEIRFNVEWPRAVTALKRNLLFGSGLGSITLATDNDYLRILGESGLVGFISFFLIILWFFIKTIPSVKVKTQNQQHQLNLIFLSCIIVSLANAIFIDVFEASKTAYTFWLLLGFFYLSLTVKE